VGMLAVDVEASCRTGFFLPTPIYILKERSFGRKTNNTRRIKYLKFLRLCELQIAITIS
jgi:hypothetical protein